MIEIHIPGREPLFIENVVMDYNGTLAVDGILPESVKDRIRSLAQKANVYILTADTYGTVKKQCQDLGITVKTFPREGAALCKEEIVKSLEGQTVCIGNGYNDVLMFELADLTIGVLEKEGVCAALLSHTDVLVSAAEDALDLLLKPARLRATLRN